MSKTPISGHAKRCFGVSLLLALALLSGCSSQLRSVQMRSQDQKVQIHLATDAAGHAYYTASYDNVLVLDTSYLGLVLQNADLSTGLRLRKLGKPTLIEDNYTLPHGKRAQIAYTHQAYTLHFRGAGKQRLICEFRLDNSGFAYRYQLPGRDSVMVLAETSTFGLHKGVKAWLQPMAVAKSGWKETNPSYEEHYLTGVALPVDSPLGEGFIYPALFNRGKNWVLLSETNLHSGYSGTRLQFDAATQGMKVTMPQTAEVWPDGALLPNGRAPFYSTWRTVAMGSLANIVENTLGTDLAEPAKFEHSASWKPGVASWSWVLLKDDFTNYETSKRFIDYAAQMNWPYCLIDADWDWKIGYERMKELVDYAAAKQVRILLWYNSSGSWNSTTYTPKSKLLTAEQRAQEFALLQDMGVAGIKVDFFGGDGQSMIAYYHAIFNDAARFNLMVNCHGATLPRGWHRTYPNLMTMEAIMGEEFVTFTQENADKQPEHCAIIPFTRNVYDPMDFTPMVLDSIPNIQRRTTPAFELALPFLFTSGIQHMAEIPEGMAKMPAPVVALLKNIPTQWDEVRFLSGYPGKDIVLARRIAEQWYIAGINGEATPKQFDLDISFVRSKTGTLFTDDAENYLKTEPVNAGKQTIQVPGHGGFLIKI